MVDGGVAGRVRGAAVDWVPGAQGRGLRLAASSCTALALVVVMVTVVVVAVVAVAVLVAVAAAVEVAVLQMISGEQPVLVFMNLQNMHVRTHTN